MNPHVETQYRTHGTRGELVITIMLDTNHSVIREDAVVLVTPDGILTGPVVGDDLDDLAYATWEDAEWR